MSWTTAKDLREQVQKLWDKGDLLRPLVLGEPLSPRRLRLSGPNSQELMERFEAVREWIGALRSTPHVRLVLREFRHRVLGLCAVPDAVWLDSLDDALALVGKTREAARFATLVVSTRAQNDNLLPWLERRPLLALELTDAWVRLLAVVAWLQAHPRPGVYLRQVDLPGVDSKFLETNRAVLAELFDLALPPSAIDATAIGLSQFCRRYGFKDKPLRVRLRVLDPALRLLHIGTGSGAQVSTQPSGEVIDQPNAADQDITLTQADFERLDWPVQRVFMTENEVNFLAFPPVPGSVVIFGAGYGFDALAQAAWLQRCPLHYWGDIDTHGLAILDQLRAHFPHVQSLLMDRATLLAHPNQWGREPQPVLRDLPRLSAVEAILYNDLRDNRLGKHLRLEQERIRFGALQQALKAIACRALPAADAMPPTTPPTTLQCKLFHA